MSEEAPEVDQGTSLNTCAESACALLDRLATAPLSQLDAPELVDQCSDVLSYVYRLNESTKSTKDIILTAWARICEVVARLGALHAHFEQPDSSLSQLYKLLIGGLTSLTNCGTAQICSAFLDCGLVRLFVEDLRRPEMYAAREMSLNDSGFVLLTLTYLGSLINVARLPDLNSRFVTLAREVQLVATVKDYAPVKENMVRTIAYMLIGWVANEQENHLANPTVSDFKFMRQILVRALKSDNHFESDTGVRAEEMLEGFANLVACADDNVSDVIAAHVPVILGAVLSGPLQADPSAKVQPGEYTKAEKLLAARCCHTMCFTPEGRAAVAATPRLAGAIAKYSKSDATNEMKEAASGCLWEIAAAENDSPADVTPPPCPPSATDDEEPEEELNDAVLGEPAEKAALDAAVKELQETLRGSKQPAEKSLTTENAGGSGNSVERAEAGPVSGVEAGIAGAAAGAAPPPQAASAVQLAAPQEEQKGHVMISYCWATKDVVKHVQQALLQMGIKVWFDEEEMRGSLIDRMAEAIEGSQAIVLCYSQGYKNSGNCRGEAQYAYKCKKPIIPVRCQERYDADGWLGFIIGSMLYYDISTPDFFTQNLPGLLKEVSRQIGNTSAEETISKVAVSTTAAALQTSSPESHPPAVLMMGPPEEYLKWDETDVQTWLEKEQLAHLKDTFKKAGVNGKVLREIRRALDKEPKFLEHMMGRPLDLLRTLRLTASLRTLQLSHP